MVVDETENVSKDMVTFANGKSTDPPADGDVPQSCSVSTAEPQTLPGSVPPPVAPEVVASSSVNATSPGGYRSAASHAAASRPVSAEGPSAAAPGADEDAALVANMIAVLKRRPDLARGVAEVVKDAKKVEAISGRKTSKRRPRIEWGDVPQDFSKALADLGDSGTITSAMVAAAIGMPMRSEAPLSKPSRDTWVEGRSGLALLMAGAGPASELTSALSAYRKRVAGLSKEDGTSAFKSPSSELSKVLFKSADWKKWALATPAVLAERAAGDATRRQRLEALAAAIADTPRWKSFAAETGVFDRYAQRVLPVIRTLEACQELWQESGEAKKLRLDVQHATPAGVVVAKLTRAAAGEVAMVAEEWASYQTTMLAEALAQAVPAILPDKIKDADVFRYSLPSLSELCDIMVGGSGMEKVRGVAPTVCDWLARLRERRSAAEGARALAANAAGRGVASSTRAATVAQASGSANFRHQAGRGGGSGGQRIPSA